jgi:hypothetical protein
LLVQRQKVTERHLNEHARQEILRACPKAADLKIAVAADSR